MALAEEEPLRVQQAEEGVTALEYILEGLEAELALERELGVRVIECDRSLLVPPPDKVASPAEPPPPIAKPAAPAVAAPARPKPPAPEGDAVLDFAFLHDRPLSPECADMMDKIVAALGKTSETAPVVSSAPLPCAKAYVVLGGLALRKWLPGVNAAPGQWVSSELSPNILVTYSPAYILRFKTVTPTVQKIKKEMWTSIKSVLRRIQG